MPAQESAEPDTPQETEISIQTGVYTGMLIAAAVCMAAACAFTFFSQPYYEMDEATGGLKKPVYAKPGEAGLKKGSAPDVEEEESTPEESTEESKPAEEKTEEEKPTGEKTEKEKPADEEKKEEAKPAEEKKEE